MSSVRNGGRIVVAGLLLASLTVAPLAADAARPIAVDTRSNVQIIRFSLGFLDRTYATDSTTFTCISFRNDDPREAREITFHFSEYDTSNNRQVDTDLVRTGRFARGAEVIPGKNGGREFDLHDCVQDPPKRANIATVFVFVKRVVYADGTEIATPGPEVPQHLGGPAAPPRAAKPEASP